MKGFLKDLVRCLEISLVAFIIPFGIGMVVGMLFYGLDLKGMLDWGRILVQFSAAIGMLVAGVSFIKPQTMRPLNYDEEWKIYFRKMNLSHVILFVCIFAAMMSYIVQIYFI